VISKVADAPLGTTSGIIGIAGPAAAPAPNSFASVTYYTAGQTVPVIVSGAVGCQFDNQVIGGDYVLLSPNNPGSCRSAGSTYPASGKVLGLALSANGPESFGAPFAQAIVLGAQVQH
jgi:hypothetical protein